MELAPIILFAFNRPEHTRKTLSALKENHLADKSELFIYIDGPKSDEQIQKINEVKRVAKENQWCGKVNIIESKTNKGLSASVIEGVTETVNKYGKVIVLEDDLVSDIWFLTFMNKSLDVYQDEKDVVCVTGYIYPVSKSLPESFFLKGADCWGWATWKRAWEILEKDGTKLLKELEAKKLTSDFDFNNTYPYVQMLKDQIEKKNNSWAILWYASAYLKNKYCLYPGHSLIQNIGIDGSGTHSGTTTNFDVILQNKEVKVDKIEVKEIGLNKEIVAEYFRQLRSVDEGDFLKRIVKKLIPDKLLEVYHSFRYPQPKLHGWFGNYENWATAQKECGGYDSSEILNKVRESVLKVRNGEAVYERDSVLFNEIQYSPDLIQSFKDSISNGKLHIVDFGGSLGSTYFQHKNLFKDVKDLKWSVVEQKHFVECGKKEIEIDNLKFQNTVEEALKEQSNQVLLLSSVIPYFEKPYELIDKMLSYDFENIIIDRTAFIEGNKERITKQIVPESIYKASYPAWFLNEAKFKKAFETKYELVREFKSAFDSDGVQEDGVRVYRKGFYFKKK